MSNLIERARIEALRQEGLKKTIDELMKRAKEMGWNITGTDCTPLDHLQNLLLVLVWQVPRVVRTGPDVSFSPHLDYGVGPNVIYVKAHDAPGKIAEFIMRCDKDDSEQPTTSGGGLASPAS
jgi:hypothetical protein